LIACPCFGLRTTKGYHWLVKHTNPPVDWVSKPTRGSTMAVSIPTFVVTYHLWDFCW